jgi:uncharacterized phage protein gp47/JayE
MPYGLTSTGFVTKPHDTIQAELESDFKEAFGDNLDVDPSTPQGHIIGVMADRLSEVWELAEGVNAARDPDAAEGASLEGVCALSGTLREEALPSSVTLTATGTAGTVLNIGQLVTVDDTEEDFATIAAATLAAATAWAAATAYVVGDIRTNATRIYRCITAGTSAGAGGPTTTAADITDNTAHWRYLGEGAAYAEVESESVNTGPVSALSGTITTIKTPVAGWASVINVLDAELGRDEELDPALRVRREDELGNSEAGPAEAIREAVLNVSGVVECTVYENMTTVTDADGLPGYHMEVVVRGGDDDEIAEAIHASKSGGAALHGTTTVNVTDSQGQVKAIKFTRPTEVPIYVVANVTKLAAAAGNLPAYPTDGNTQVRDAILSRAAEIMFTGRDVVSAALEREVWDVDGLLDITNLYIGTAPAPASEATVAITTRQIATFDSSRVTVNSSNGSL